MSLSYLNILLFLNTLVAALVPSRFNKNPVSPILFLGGVITYAVVQAGTSFSEETYLWPAIIVAAVYYFYESITLENTKRAPIALSAFIGLIPLLLVAAQTPYALSLYLIGFTLFRQLVISEQPERKKAFIARIQALDAAKISLLLIACAFYAYEKELALFLTLTLAALMYAGYFESSKDSKRSQEALSATNPVLEEFMGRVLTPGALLVASKQVLEKLEFTQYMFAQKMLIFLLLAALVSAVRAVWLKPNSSLRYFKLFMLFLIPGFLFIEKSTPYKFMTFMLLASCLHVLTTVQFKNTSTTLRKVLTAAVLPTPFSPLVWLVTWEAIKFQGPGKELLISVVGAFLLISFLTFSKHKPELMNNPNLAAVKPMSLISITVMTLFVTILFIARILI